VCAQLLTIDASGTTRHRLGSDVMTALPDWDIASDAPLAGAAATGDREAFAGIFDRYADRLHDFSIGVVRDRDAAADCVLDVFCTAAARLPKLCDRDRLRPWFCATGARRPGRVHAA
jgi:hypothetical protein